jgi:hypothetical protein
MATDAELALEVARLRRDLADLASAVATLEARFVAAQANPPAEQAQSAADQPAIIVPQRRPTSEERQRQEWLAGLPCVRCTHPLAVDVRHLIAQDTLSPHGATTPSGLPMVCCRVTHALRNNTDRTWTD